jgi:hypothetical protein
MPKRIPIQVAKDLAKAQGLKQVIITAFDHDGREHVVTYGVTKIDCAQAAQGGNFVKAALGWPGTKCGEVPARIKALEKKAKERDALYAAGCRLIRQAGALITTVSIGGLLDVIWPMVPTATLDGIMEKPLDPELSTKLNVIKLEADKLDLTETPVVRLANKV